MDLVRGQNTVSGRRGDTTSLPRKPWRSLQPNIISFVVLPACGTGFYMKSEKCEGRLQRSSFLLSIYLFRLAAARMIVHPDQADCQRFCAPAGIHEFVSV